MIMIREGDHTFLTNLLLMGDERLRYILTDDTEVAVVIAQQSSMEDIDDALDAFNKQQHTYEEIIAAAFNRIVRKRESGICKKLIRNHCFTEQAQEALIRIRQQQTGQRRLPWILSVKKNTHNKALRLPARPAIPGCSHLSYSNQDPHSRGLRLLQSA